MENDFISFDSGAYKSYPKQFQISHFYTERLVESIVENHNFIFSKNDRPDTESLDCVVDIVKRIVPVLERSSAAYHDIEHTYYVVTCGLDIVKGRFIQTGDVTEKNWRHFVVALLLHDIGYIRNILKDDDDDYQLTNKEGDKIALTEENTDAKLTNFHVFRGTVFAKDFLRPYPLLKGEVIATLIAGTEFPLPEKYESNDYDRLVQAADLIGQMADIYYTSKTTALFDEFEENDALEKLNVQNPRDLIANYPKFFWNLVYPNIQLALKYLNCHEDGRVWMASLIDQIFYEENNVLLNEKASVLLKEVLRVKHFARNHNDKLQLLADILKNYYSAEIAHVYSKGNAEEEKLTTAKIWSYDDSDFEKFREETEKLSFERGYGMPGKAWESGEVQWISNLGDMDPKKFPRAGVCKELGIKFAFGIPYYVGNNCNDVIELFSKKAAEPTDADKAFIKIITSTINS